MKIGFKNTKEIWTFLWTWVDIYYPKKKGVEPVITKVQLDIMPSHKKLEEIAGSLRVFRPTYLLDSNEKRIYEGHRLECLQYGYVGFVVYNDNSEWKLLRFYDKELTDWQIMDITALEARSHKIIGHVTDKWEWIDVLEKF